MKLMKFNYLLLLIVSILASGCSIFNTADKHSIGPEDKKRVLVLNSYSHGNPWTDNIVRAINDQFQDDENVIINMEYMDTKMVSNSAHFNLLKRLYKNKYGQYTIDVIIASDDNALKFLRKYRKELFPGVPVVFCGINNFSPRKVKSFDNYTGINETSDNISNFELILKLHPDVKTLYVINGYLTTAKSLRTEFFEALKEYEDKFEFKILSDVSLPRLLEKVGSLEEDSIVYYLSFFRDNTGRAFAPSEVIPYVSKASPVPVYGSVDYMLDLGIVGGMLKSAYFQGESAAKSAQKILAGAKAEEIPVMMHNTSFYMFNYDQLKRFNIDASDLPKESIIINRPDT